MNPLLRISSSISLELSCAIAGAVKAATIRLSTRPVGERLVLSAGRLKSAVGRGILSGVVEHRPGRVDPDDRFARLDDRSDASREIRSKPQQIPPLGI
jgi:hypothetical protein